MSPVTQYLYDGTKWQNETVTARSSAAGAATATYPPNYGRIGSYRPSAATTGVPAGTTLKRYPAAGSADLIVTKANQVIDGLDIHGRVLVQAAGVTIQRCRVRGKSVSVNTSCIVATSAACSRLTIRDCEIIPEFPSIWINGVNGHDFTLLRSEICHSVDGLGLYNTTAPGTDLRVVVQGNWIHDLAYFSPDPNHADNKTHNDGIQVQGGTGARVQGNYVNSFRMGTNQVALSCMLFNDNVGRCGGHIIEDNWFGGGFVPINGLDTSLGTSNLGRFHRNKFEGNSYARLTVRRVQSVVWDFAGGTSNQNVYSDSGKAIVVAT